MLYCVFVFFVCLYLCAGDFCCESIAGGGPGRRAAAVAGVWAWRAGTADDIYLGFDGYGLHGAPRRMSGMHGLFDRLTALAATAVFSLHPSGCLFFSKNIILRYYRTEDFPFECVVSPCTDTQIY